MLKAVIFDVDGVLINSIPTHHKVINQAFRKHGFQLSDIKGHDAANSLRDLLAQVKAQRRIDLDFDQFLAEIVPDISATLSDQRADPDLVSLLGQLQKSKIKLGVGSSAIRSAVVRNLKTLGVEHYFEAIITAEDVPRHKPHPDIYLAVLHELNLKPTECVVIEDAEGGVQAAQAAGISVVGFGKYNDAPEEPLGADLHVTDWGELNIKVLDALTHQPASSLRGYWNRGNMAIPEDKDPSAYAANKEPTFPRHATICELGAGVGSDALYFAQRGHKVMCADIADDALGVTTQQFRRAKLESSLQTVQVDFATGKIPLLESSFGVVYSHLSLHYFEPKIMTSLLSEVYRLLKSGGLACIAIKSPEDPAEAEYWVGKAENLGSGVFKDGNLIKTLYTEDQLSKFATSAGIPGNEISIKGYKEHMGGRNDVIKSGNDDFILNDILIRKHA